MVGQNLTSRFNIFLAIGILNIFCACGEAGFKEVADFKINGFKVLMHNKDYLGIPTDELILKVEGVELILSLTPELFESHRGLYWKVENKPFSVVSTEKRIKLNELNVQKPTRISLCEGLEGPCLSAFVLASMAELQEEVKADDLSPISEVQEKYDPVMIEDRKNYSTSNKVNSTASNKSQTNQEHVQNKIAEEQRRKEEQQNSQRAEDERIKNEAQEKKSIKTEATPVIVEKAKPSSPKLIREGIVLQLSKESCITTYGHPSGGGSMKLSASMPIRLRGASVYASRDGRCKFTLTGPAGERGTLIKSLNAGTNAIRFSEWPHLILQNGETWILEFEGQGGVELYELNDCVKITGSELRPMNKMFLYNLTYYN